MMGQGEFVLYVGKNGLIPFGYLATVSDDTGAIGQLPDGQLRRPNLIRVGTGGIISAGPIVQSGGVRNVAAADSPVAVATADGTIRANAAAGAITVNLPPAAQHTGRVLNIKKLDNSANAVTVDGDGAETIDGAAGVALSVQYANLTIQSNGVSWDIL